MIVLDGCTPAHLPKCRYLVFGSPPDGIDVTSPEEIENQVIVDWRTKHPALQYVNLANLFRLTGYDLIAPQPKPVETMAVTLYWQRTPTYSPINFDVFVQLEDAAGHIWGQSNGAPNCGKQLTSTWAEQEIVVDPHIIPIDPQTPPGDYFLAVGMSVSGENFRLPVVTEEGQSETEVVKLGTITID